MRDRFVNFIAFQVQLYSHVGGSAAEGQRGYQGNCRQLGAFIHCRTCDKRPTPGGESWGRVGLIAFKQMSNLEHFDDLFYDLCGLSMYTVHVSEKGNTPNKGFDS